MTRSTIILGISAYYHDSAAALVINGDIVAAAQEERFTRKKHDPSFPKNAVTYVLEEAGLSLADVTHVAFYDKPYIKFERLLETYHLFAPQGLRSFLSAMPVWIKEKLFLKKLIKDELAELGAFNAQLLFPEHHLSHAASAYYPSPYEEAAILSMDGVGEWTTTSIGHGKGKELSFLKEVHFPHSLGLLYSAFTYYCGFKVNSGEYKLMGLAPYGIPHDPQTIRFKEQILDQLIDVREDGSFLLNMAYFNYATGLTMTRNAKFKKLFGLPKRESESQLTQAYMNLALAIQQVTEEIVLKLAKTATELTQCRNLVLSGGVALNCVANGKLLKSGLVDALWIQPASGDAGGALGAALAVWHIHLENARQVTPGKDAMKGAYLGPSYGQHHIDALAHQYAAVGQTFDSDEALVDAVAACLDNGDIVGWSQGRMEFGPRALGNRSIIADPRKPDMQKKLNLKIKYREGFRPFAPAVLAEDVGAYFEINGPSPYMLLVAPVAAERCTKEPGNYQAMAMYDRLYHLRSDIPSITHVDYSARVQTVHQDTNPKFSALLETFKQKTGCSVLINTSFNVRGEPIVNTPEDAYRCFMRTEMDVLVINNTVYKKADQPALSQDSNWQEEFALD